MSVTVESLEKKFKGEGLSRFSQIALLGGFGKVGPNEQELDPASSLDIEGVLDSKNKAVGAEDKAKIAELAGGSVEAPETSEVVPEAPKSK